VDIMSQLTHLNAAGEAHMVDISGKDAMIIQNSEELMN